MTGGTTSRYSPGPRACVGLGAREAREEVWDRAHHSVVGGRGLSCLVSQWSPRGPPHTGLRPLRAHCAGPCGSVSPGTVNLHGVWRSEEARAKPSAPETWQGTGSACTLGTSLWPTSRIVLRNLGGLPGRRGSLVGAVLPGEVCWGPQLCPLMCLSEGLAGEALWGQGVGQGPPASRARHLEVLGRPHRLGTNELPTQAVFPLQRPS